MRLRFLPKSLAGRTILALLFSFACVQLLGLVIQTFNQIKLERLEDERELATRAAIIYRHIALAPAAARADAVAREPLPRGDTLILTNIQPPRGGTFDMPLPVRQFIRASIFAFGMPPAIRPHGLDVRGVVGSPALMIIFGLPDNRPDFHGAPPGTPTAT